jgi:hypothetical protein
MHYPPPLLSCPPQPCFSILTPSIELHVFKQKHLTDLHSQQPSNTAGADGPKWAAAVTPIIGGKAGGKPGAPTAIGQGTNADKVDDGVEEARRWIEAIKM